MNLQRYSDQFDDSDVIAHSSPLEANAHRTNGRDSAPNLQGQRIGPCTLLGVLAEGSRGWLYRARRVDNGARMVVQFLDQPDADLYDLRRTPLQHSSLWPVQGAGTYAGRSYLLSPELVAPALFEFDLADERSVNESVRLLLPVIDAVAVLHRHGLLHLRLSPANVRIVRQHAVLMDVGTSRYLHGRSNVGWSGPSQHTPWLAPEQRDIGTRVSKQTDVYGLGLLLLAAVSAQSPAAFDGLPREAWRERAPLVPNAVWQICMRALQPEPSERFPDAAAMALDLRQYTTRIRSPSPRNGWSDRVWQRLQQALR
ncbi:hypothetical protein C7S18_20095 [Ahniella affigens]|uniref:Protein kinase domain-containing protein n=1 Tax=Ahniella affigens TaxID=2021234 RepID=A0A2P1PWV8_9GAMM|nr:protein kinase [Ahniella affigens]AVP99329.1 hypothetical protein C7S18_20095 [Ahniella affigens]